MRTSTASTPSCTWPALSNDPLGDLNPELTYEINHRASVRLAEIAKEAGVAPLHLLVVVQQLRRGVDDWLDEESAFNPVTPYGQLQGQRRAGRVANWPTTASAPTFLRSATAYGVSPRLRFDLVLNNLTAWAYHDRADLSEERRHALAADRPHRGHGAGLRRRAEAPRETDPQRGVQHRPHRRELPHPRDGRDRRRDRARQPRRVRRRRHPTSATTA